MVIVAIVVCRCSRISTCNPIAPEPLPSQQHFSRGGDSHMESQWPAFRVDCFSFFPSCTAVSFLQIDNKPIDRKPYLWRRGFEPRSPHQILTLSNKDLCKTRYPKLAPYFLGFNTILRTSETRNTASTGSRIFTVLRHCW